jgi:hypothetical protein
MQTEVYPVPQNAQSTAADPFLRQLLLILVISALLLIPCFWHRHIEAGDLGSHLYNAWLAQLIEQGKAPGLYIVRQWNNVLVDLLLLNFVKMFGFAVAEKLLVSMCVLVFFWGVFALMKTLSGQTPWFLVPCVAMLNYGHLFHSGFLNYFLSVGLCCIALSLLWTGRRNGLIAAACLAPVILLAHPLGFALFIGVAAYGTLWRFLPRWNWLLPIAAIATCYAVRVYLLRHAEYDLQWREFPLWRMTGADQFHVFGAQYAFFTRAILLLASVSSVIALLRAPNRVQFWKERRLFVELYFVLFCGMALLPESIHFDPTAGWVGALSTRLTLILAIIGLCWLASLPSQRWQLAAYAVVAVAFFGLIYRDTAFLNRMEFDAEQVTHSLPFGTRVLATIHLPGDYRATFVHIVDRACIGHCFLVSNYEPSTKQFRIRVQPGGSPVVTASFDDSDDMQSGNYDVQDEDLPLKQIYQCDGRDLTQICIRDLAADEKNGRIGYNAQPDQASTQSAPANP